MRFYSPPAVYTFDPPIDFRRLPKLRMLLLHTTCQPLAIRDLASVITSCERNFLSSKRHPPRERRQYKRRRKEKATDSEPADGKFFYDMACSCVFGLCSRAQHYEKLRLPRVVAAEFVDKGPCGRGWARRSSPSSHLWLRSATTRSRCYLDDSR